MSGSAWADTVAACIVGTERAGVAPTLPAGLQALTLDAGSDRLLDTMAALAVWRLAGQRVLDPDGVVPVEAMAEALPECSDAQAARLELILDARGLRAEVCREWCRLAAAAGVRAPPGLALHVFARSRERNWRDKYWQADADGVLGGRLPWLQTESDAGAPRPTADDWANPDVERRVAALRLMRADPAVGRAALEAVWHTEPAEVRVKLLRGLWVNLSADDEPFLEARLDDRSSHVRSTASEALAYVPGSRRNARCEARGRAAMQVRPGAGSSPPTLIVNPPEWDAAMVRDGLGQDRKPWPDPFLLFWVVQVAPLSAWTQAEPATWIRLAMENEWAKQIVPGWVTSASNRGDAAWLSALADGLLAARREEWTTSPLHGIAMACLPDELRERIALAMLRDGPIEGFDLWVRCEHDWSWELTKAALDWIGSTLLPSIRDARWTARHDTLRLPLGILALHARVASADELAALQAGLPDDAAPAIQQAINEAVETLAFRQAMHREFAP